MRLLLSCLIFLICPIWTAELPTSRVPTPVFPQIKLLPLLPGEMEFALGTQPHPLSLDSHPALKQAYTIVITHNSKVGPNDGWGSLILKDQWLTRLNPDRPEDKKYDVWWGIGETANFKGKLSFPMVLVLISEARSPSRLSLWTPIDIPIMNLEQMPFKALDKELKLTLRKQILNLAKPLPAAQNY